MDMGSQKSGQAFVLLIDGVEGVLSVLSSRQEYRNIAFAQLPQANVIYGSVCLPPTGSDVGGVPPAPSVKVKTWDQAWGFPRASPGRDPTSGLPLVIPGTKFLGKNLTNLINLILCSSGKPFVTNFSRKAIAFGRRLKSKGPPGPGR